MMLRVAFGVAKYCRKLSLHHTYRTRVVKENTMPMDAGDIEKLIKEALPDATVTIRDLAGDGDHYAAEVVSESFRGKTRVAQHKMVYDALQGNMGGVLHALALQTSVPE
jgi:stress-induced morphogen